MGLEDNTAGLARLLIIPEELSCQVAEGDIVTACGFESPEPGKCLHDHTHGIHSATHETDTYLMVHAEAVQLHGLDRNFVVCIETDELVLLLYFKHQLLRDIRIHHECEGRIEKSIPRITIWHHEACQVMANGDAEGRILLSYPHTNNGFFFLLITVFFIF